MTPTTNAPRVHLITLGVRDMPVARTYYEAMGWRAAPYSMDQVAFFQSGDQVLGLYLQASLNHDTGLQAPRPGGITLAINTHSPAEVDALYAKALAVGAKSLAEPKTTPWGGYTCYVAAPDGHPWEFSYVAQFLPDETGALILPDSL